MDVTLCWPLIELPVQMGSESVSTLLWSVRLHRLKDKGGNFQIKEAGEITKADHISLSHQWHQHASEREHWLPYKGETALKSTNIFIHYKIIKEKKTSDKTFRILCLYIQI